MPTEPKAPPVTSFDIESSHSAMGNMVAELNSEQTAKCAEILGQKE